MIGYDNQACFECIKCHKMSKSRAVIKPSLKFDCFLPVWCVSLLVSFWVCSSPLRLSFFLSFGSASMKAKWGQPKKRSKATKKAEDATHRQNLLFTLPVTTNPFTRWPEEPLEAFMKSRWGLKIRFLFSIRWQKRIEKKGSGDQFSAV